MTKVAGELGLTFAGGARVVAATEAWRADAAARHEQLAADALDGALAQVERVGAADPARDARDYATAARALTEVHAKVVKLKSIPWKGGENRARRKATSTWSASNGSSPAFSRHSRTQNSAKSCTSTRYGTWSVDYADAATAAP
ncbi:hypothetical protein [Streptomyces sp. NPDC052097]|uniref:hypothetical protein n=1 Tax=Streptomyces sp. NPDC052097 TaxID=3154948 RepID=UPI00344DE51D